jgi:hypothetical protein
MRFPHPLQTTCNAARVHRVSAARIYRGKRERANNSSDTSFLWGNGVLDVGRTLKCSQEKAPKVCTRLATRPSWPIVHWLAVTVTRAILPPPITPLQNKMRNGAGTRIARTLEVGFQKKERFLLKSETSSTSCFRLHITTKTATRTPEWSRSKRKYSPST